VGPILGFASDVRTSCFLRESKSDDGGVTAMTQEPSQISFVCESCQERVTVDEARRLLGECRRCQGQSWTLVVSYTDEVFEGSLPGLLATTVLGGGWHETKTYSNHTVLEGVSAEVVQVLTEEPSLTASRVADYVRLREQLDLREQGARPCGICKVLYVPTESKPWTQQGYCSELCASRGGVNTARPLEASAERRHVSTIAVVCPHGHEFEVLAMFKGCTRPCTECGAKTPVP